MSFGLLSRQSIVSRATRFGIPKKPLSNITCMQQLLKLLSDFCKPEIPAWSR